MARLADDYKRLLISLLPKGAVWNRELTSNLSKLMEAIAQEYKRIDDRSRDLITERQVKLTTELITEHETDYGIPVEGESLGATIALRREDLYAALLKVGQQNTEYFEEIADALGYTIEIDQYQPFWVGFSTVDSPVGDQYNLFYWTVLIDATLIAESIDVNITKLINNITAVKPAHTHVLFDWNNVEFDRSFSIDFNRKPHYDNSWRVGEFGREFDNSFANAYDYDGVNYIGAFDYSFSIAFDRRSGGEFFADEFSSAFTRPS